MDILLYNERKKLALNEINLKPVKLLGEWKIPIGWGLKLLKINILLNLMIFTGFAPSVQSRFYIKVYWEIFLWFVAIKSNTRR